jgi:hypothetical protein
MNSQIKEVIILSNEGKPLRSEVLTYAAEDTKWYTDALKHDKRTLSGNRL